MTFISHRSVKLMKSYLTQPSVRDTIVVQTLMSLMIFIWVHSISLKLPLFLSSRPLELPSLSPVLCVCVCARAWLLLPSSFIRMKLSFVLCKASPLSSMRDVSPLILVFRSLLFSTTLDFWSLFDLSSCYNLNFLSGMRITQMLNEVRPGGSVQHGVFWWRKGLRIRRLLGFPQEWLWILLA